MLEGQFGKFINRLVYGSKFRNLLREDKRDSLRLVIVAQPPNYCAPPNYYAHTPTKQA